MADNHLRTIDIHTLEVFVNTNRKKHQEYIRLLCLRGFSTDIAYLISMFAGSKFVDAKQQRAKK